jgi:hypothetical protein
MLTRLRGCIKRCEQRAPLYCLRNSRLGTASTSGSPPYVVSPPTEADFLAIEEQVGRGTSSSCSKKDSIISVSCGSCKYKHPQSFLFSPIKGSIWKNRKTVQSATFRLSCPHLVKGIDEIEAEGGVKRYNEMLALKPEWVTALHRINAESAQIRYSHLLVSSHGSKCSLNT